MNVMRHAMPDTWNPASTSSSRVAYHSTLQGKLISSKSIAWSEELNLSPLKSLLMLTAICLVVLLQAQLIKIPSALPADSGAVVVSSKGEGQRWTANWTMEPVERAGRKKLRLTERGRGHVSPFSEEIQWSLESVWSTENGVRPLDSEKISSRSRWIVSFWSRIVAVNATSCRCCCAIVAMSVERDAGSCSSSSRDRDRLMSASFSLRPRRSTSARDASES